MQAITLRSTNTDW